jgi:DNA-binding XRE family transcriptional regulator
VLIDIKSGRLCNGLERTDAFTSEPQFNELVSSMTRELDNGRIQRVVAEYFQYVTLSHVWEGKEPSFQDVNMANSVWDLDSSPLNEKLHKFCEVVRTHGYRWAWSDTCCIDKTISTVLNQSLTMMYKWYEASAAMFVLLASVASPSTLGDLTDSTWMTRAWTAQELLAAKVVRFYDRDWKPYLGDMRSNHKESPEIMQELAEAIGVARETIIAFDPNGLGVREKLRLASTRNATVEEDVAYSLIGIFKSDIMPRYGEGDAALGHLLEEIVARSGEVTVLDWTGMSSPYNSCLPATLAVYHHTPRNTSPAIEDAEMDVRVGALRDSLSHTEAMLIHDRVTRLPPARFANRRLYLPCIIFAVKRLSVEDFGSGQENRYRARVSGIGYVEFQTSDRLSLMEPRKLIFVHPWIRDLRDPLDGFAWGGTADDDEYGSDPETEAGSAPTSPLQALPAATMDDYTRALRLVARLQQPFHVLLLQQQPNGEFKRVAAEHEIVAPGLEQRINFAREIRTQVVEIL